MTQWLTVKGARVHNLKNVHVRIPKHSLVLFTGLSGSGKSSLAFDTIYAEGHRRYIESLSSYARQFLNMMQKPDVDSIEGLSPAISIEQKTISRNPRSTVGTMTEIYDYMRVLFARVGVAYSPQTGEPIAAQSIDDMARRCLQFAPTTKLEICAPIVRGKKGEYRKELEQLRKKGFVRVIIDNTRYTFDALPLLDKNKKHDIFVVIDRVVIKDHDDALVDSAPQDSATPQHSMQSRLAHAFEVACALTDGLAAVVETDSNRCHLFSQHLSCPVSGFVVPEMDPRLFSFNSPFGACSACAGLGTEAEVDLSLVIPDPSKTLRQGAILPWNNSFAAYYQQILSNLSRFYDFSLDCAYEDLSDDIKNIILYGSSGQIIPMTMQTEHRTTRVQQAFEGLVPSIMRKWKKQQNEESSDDDHLSNGQNYTRIVDCKRCLGTRLKPESLCVKIAHKHIGEINHLCVSQALSWFQHLPEQLSKHQNEIAQGVVKEITSRLVFLEQVGLEYMTLSRSASTLSGGESQRIRLASQLGSMLTGVLYVLDEPSIGLHPRDNARLINTLCYLRDLGNTVIVVEHDEEAIRRADYIVDIGPKAGIHGGSLVVSGTIEDVMQCSESLTGAYLRRERFIEVPTQRRPLGEQYIELQGVHAHNLKNVDMKLPLACFVGIAGVSGSGKSSLIMESLLHIAKRFLDKHPKPYENYASFATGFEHIARLVHIDQSPIGRTPRSNPATYVGAFTPLREWYSQLPEAKAKGYKPGRFSFNVKGGRCEACEGDGMKKIEMHFLSDVYVTCDACQGKRYNSETLRVKYNNRSIADALDLTIEEALVVFASVPSLRDKCQALHDVGLGYIKLGQSAITLSGGEAQRVKLAKELSKKSHKKTLYILDEPTTGLHAYDVHMLLHVLHRLVDQGHTVVVIEHNVDVLKTADYIFDLGPEGGAGGGIIVAQGTPEEVAHNPKSVTGPFLRDVLFIEK